MKERKSDPSELKEKLQDVETFIIDSSSESESEVNGENLTTIIHPSNNAIVDSTELKFTNRDHDLKIVNVESLITSGRSMLFTNFC